jgi:RNA polymerase sigma-70 factor (ECF subfamily)
MPAQDEPGFAAAPVSDAREHPATRGVESVMGVALPVRESLDPADDALVASAAGGDVRAFEEIVKRHAGLVLGLGRRVLGNRAEAEDLLQDVFMKVHRSLSTFRGESSLKTWIARVTMNAARNRRRDEGRRLRLVSSLDAPLKDGEDSTLGDRVADCAPDAERLALSTEARTRIETAIHALPPEFREALVLREIEGLSYDEIAAALEINVGTVKSRLARARTRLQEALADLVDGQESP